MNITITEKKEQPELRRTQIIADCVYEDAATPSRATLIKEIAGKAKVPAEQMIVKNIKSRYGGGGATITAFAYKTVESMNVFEAPYMVKKNAPKAQAEAKAE